jgi:uncharacterized membrane protein YfcA
LQTIGSCLLPWCSVLLLLEQVHIKPTIARNFSLAIQSIGMTAAALLIYYNKIKVEYRYVLLISIGGAIGMVIGTIFIAPYMNPAFVKILFVTFWLSFGFVLFFVNEIKKRSVEKSLPQLNLSNRITINLVGLVGGIISSLLGSGIDIFSFSYLTLRHQVSEKVATPTSVVIMAINSIVGFTLHLFVLNDFGVTEFNYWMVSIPIVLIGAPLGAYLINKRTREFVSRFLYIIITVQFIGAFLIIKPTGLLLVFSGLIFLTGILLFLSFKWLSKKEV